MGASDGLIMPCNVFYNGKGFEYRDTVLIRMMVFCLEALYSNSLTVRVDVYVELACHMSLMIIVFSYLIYSMMLVKVKLVYLVD